jgi:hypothetical protein
MSSPVVQRPFSIQVPLRGYDTLFTDLINAIPSGTFYDFTHPIVLWQSKPNLFIFNTDNYNVPVQVICQRTGDYKTGVDQGNLVSSTFITPLNPQTSFSLTLGLGLNRIVAQEMIQGGRQTILDVVATPNELIVDSIATQINVSQTTLANVESALYSDYSTRLLDQVIQFQALLPDFQSLRILATKLVVRGMVHFPAEYLGVNNVISSFTLNNPVYQTQRQSSNYQIERNPIMRAQEAFAGMEAHLWFPNTLITRWVAFTRMANSLRSLYTLKSVSDIEVDLTFQGREQIHTFDLTSPGASILSSVFTNCFNSIQIQMTSSFKLNHKIFVWSYPFDEFVTALTAIGVGRSSFDLGIPFDSGIPLDQDPVDPFTDGWIGWSLSGRFERDVSDTSLARYSLDTGVDPSPLFTGNQGTVYPGPYTQMMNSMNYEIDLDSSVQINSSQTNWDSYTSGPVTGLGLQIPFGPFQAGVPVLAYAKYVDAKGMSNLSGSGFIEVQELNGTSEQVPVASGFQAFELTPTVAGPHQTWALSDGTYTAVSESREVLPGGFAAFRISTIGPQVKGVPFLVSIQATDAYGNDITDVGINTKVTIQSTDGFLPGEVTPNYVQVVNGAATVQVTMSVAGSGTLTFSILPVASPSNYFTVT